ncbi:MAG: UPF0280 family protein [Methanomicrobiaceae archaeon]|nr:UPF0280 family protein [Methanomicrobiaceae archaeon]
MIREHFQYRQTIATLLADDQRHIAAAKEGMIAARQELERFLATDPFFGSTFEPCSPQSSSTVIRRMALAAEPAGVGPMAAVAGTIAWAGVEAMVDAGASFAVVDNGGDIALIADREVRIGIYAGTSPFSNRLAFLVPPQEETLGICTSSATVGPSISFGTADAVTVFSRDVAAADAWATSLCNRFEECREEFFAPLQETAIEGVHIIAGDRRCAWGHVPRIVAACVDESLITAGK